MTDPESIPLKFNLRAHYITRAELARQQRAEAENPPPERNPRDRTH